MQCELCGNTCPELTLSVFGNVCRHCLNNRTPPRRKAGREFDWFDSPNKQPKLDSPVTPDTPYASSTSSPVGPIASYCIDAPTQVVQPTNQPNLPHTHIPSGNDGVDGLGYVGIPSSDPDSANHSCAAQKLIALPCVLPAVAPVALVRRKRQPKMTRNVPYPSLRTSYRYRCVDNSPQPMCPSTCLSPPPCQKTHSKMWCRTHSCSRALLLLVLVFATLAVTLPCSVSSARHRAYERFVHYWYRQ